MTKRSTDAHAIGNGTYHVTFPIHFGTEGHVMIAITYGVRIRS